MIEYIFLILFFLAAFANVFGEYKENNTIKLCSKPLLMPFLILFYIFGIIEATNLTQVDWLIVVALIGGWIGDVFLLFVQNDKSEKENKKWFLVGMIAFLVNQILYIVSFFLSISDIASFNTWAFFLLGPALIMLIYMVPRPIKNAAEMKIPLLAYMLIILTMHIAAVLRLAEFQGLPFIFVYIGSISFIYSDASIAVNQWDKKIRKFGVISMATYILAQFFIVLGVFFTALL